MIEKDIKFSRVTYIKVQNIRPSSDIDLDPAEAHGGLFTIYSVLLACIF
jgi:hypothetical protein